MQIRDVDYYNETDRETHIAWTETILRTLAPGADLSTLRLYVEWLKIPDLPEPGVTYRSSYYELHRGVNGWMSINDCHALASTLPYIGLSTIVRSAILHKAHTYSTPILKRPNMAAIRDL